MTNPAQPMALPGPGEDTTALLHRWGHGDRAAADELLRRLEPELRRLAHRERRRRDLSIDTSDLLQDTWLRVVAQRRTRWENRHHFFALIARWLRRAAADAAAGRRRLKRDAHLRQSLDGVEPAYDPPPFDRLVLSQALSELTALDPLAGRVVELLFYSGSTVEEAACSLELSRATVVRRWRFARAWLHRYLEAG